MPFFSKNPRALIEKDAAKQAVQQATDKDGPHSRAFGDPYVHVLEQALSKKLGDVSVLIEKKVTGALFMALKTLRVGSGDEVIVSAFCHPSNISPILWLGAVPVFVDIRLDDYALDPVKIEEKITERTKAILVVHLFGQPVLGISEILKIADRKSLMVIENAAQVFMGKIKIDGKQRLCGTLGDIGCLGFLSLDASCMVFRRDGVLYERAKKLKTFRPNDAFYGELIIRPLEMLKSYEDQLKQRRKLAEYYTDQLSGMQGIILPKSYEGAENTWTHYAVRTERNDGLSEYFLAQGIKLIYRPGSYFSGLQEKRGTFPMTEKAVSETIFLPIATPCTMEDAVRTVESIKAFFEK